MSRAKLLPCPFCGSHPQMVKAEEEKGLAALVHCTWEHCPAQPSVASHEDERAIKWWNHRRAEKTNG